MQVVFALMLSIGGIVFTMIAIFGGFVLEGGNLAPIIEACPFELMMILGSAIGAMLVSNSMEVVKDVARGIKQVIKGPKWKASRLPRPAVPAVRVDQDPEEQGRGRSGAAYRAAGREHDLHQISPHIAHDHFVGPFVCDTMRIVTMNVSDPHQLDDIMEKQLEKHHHEEGRSADAMQSMADGLPALGIVAAVLGIIKTMGSISEPPEVLGHLIGAALTGTFLGVFLAYGIVGPLAGRMKQLNARRITSSC